jgi:hypothetical protein
MARSRGILYFAPGIPYSEVDIENDEIISQFRQRLDGFYLRPAHCLIDPETTFAAGVLIICCMDALSRYDANYYLFKAHRERFPKWIAGELKSFLGNEKLATRFYRAFRCGLVHEARIKHIGEFSLDTRTTVTLQGNFLVVNPNYLLAEVNDALNAFASKFKNHTKFAEHFRKELRADFIGHFPTAPKLRNGFALQVGRFSKIK